jgi:hypothetical protein
MRNLHCFDLLLPTNIYSMCVLHDKDFDYTLDETNFVFVATSNCVFCIQQIPNTITTTTVSDPSNPAANLLSKCNNNNGISSDNSELSSNLFNSCLISNLQMNELPIHNTRIPADTDIISISAFRRKRNLKKSSSGLSLSAAANQSNNQQFHISKSRSLTNLNIESSNDDLIVLAVTMAQFLGEETQPQCYLYLYKFTERELLLYSSQSNLSSASPLITTTSFEDSNFIRSFSLNFVPLQLLRKNVSYEGNNESMFLISGSDKKIHIFAPDNRYSSLQFSKVDNVKFKYEFLPSLMNLQGSALCIDMYESEHSQVTAIGYQNGFLQVLIKSKNGSTDGRLHDTPPLFLNGPVNSVKLFRCRPNNVPNCSHFLISRTIDIINEGTTQKQEGLDDDLNCLNLVVGEAVGRVTVFRNVEKMLFNDPLVIMPQIFNNKNNHSSNEEHRIEDFSDLHSFDSVLCTHIADIDGDGLNEILVGTYSKNLLVFKVNMEMNSEKSSISFELYQKFKFPAPVYSLKTLDINSDGLDELFVCSMFHIHVMQPDLGQAKFKVKQRLKAMYSLMDSKV